VWFACLAVGGTHKCDVNAPLAQMRQDAARKDLVIGMSKDREQRRTKERSHNVVSLVIATDQAV
jgi:hypothetical protein